MSPERSPWKPRPVRLPPSAAGASPTISSRGRSDPQPGTGRPQYGCAAKDFRFATAICSRHATSRGQVRQTDTAASSSATDSTSSAMAATCPGVDATGVPAAAGSPGQPEPGGTGESNTLPSRGWGKGTRPLCRVRKSVVDPDGPLLDFRQILMSDTTSRGPVYRLLFAALAAAAGNGI